MNHIVDGGRFWKLVTTTLCVHLSSAWLHAQTNDVISLPPLQDTGLSLLRVVGALLVVLMLFFGGVWCVRNWQRLAIQKNGSPKLNLLEVKPLSHHHALYLVGYEQQRFLLASSPTGVSLICELPLAEATSQGTPPPAKPTFAQALQQTLGRRS